MFTFHLRRLPQTLQKLSTPATIHVPLINLSRCRAPLITVSQEVLRQSRLLTLRDFWPDRRHNYSRETWFSRPKVPTPFQFHPVARTLNFFYGVVNAFQCFGCIYFCSFEKATFSFNYIYINTEIRGEYRYPMVVVLDSFTRPKNYGSVRPPLLNDIRGQEMVMEYRKAR